MQPADLGPHLAPYEGPLWRVIEGQARSSTLRLVDTFAEHDVLEAMLEASKPPVPPECQHLDYRLWSPFRYGSYPGNSRFRRRGRTPGVWYGSEQVLTAICETVWGKLAFFAAAPDTPLPRAAVDYTAVQALAQTPAALDLTAPALAAMGNWTDPDDYAPCLALADAARAAGVQAIRYASVRHPEGAANVALLSCRAFAQPRPVAEAGWQILYRPGHVRASCETSGTRVSLTVAGHRLTLSERA